MTIPTEEYLNYTGLQRLVEKSNAAYTRSFITQLYWTTEGVDASIIFSQNYIAKGSTFTYNSSTMTRGIINASSLGVTSGSNYKYAIMLRHTGGSLSSGWIVQNSLYLGEDNNGAEGSIYLKQGDLIHSSNPGYPSFYFLEWNSSLGGALISEGLFNSGGGSMTNPMTTAEDLIKGGANGSPTRLGKGSDGQVLKIVNGAIVWANDTGKQLYEHNIRVYYSTNNFTVTFKLITDSPTAYTYSTLTTSNNKGLYALGFTSGTTVCPACGFYGTSSAQNLIIGVYGYNSTSAYRLYFRYTPLVSYSSPTATINNTIANSYTYLTLSSSYTVNDVVRTL